MKFSKGLLLLLVLGTVALLSQAAQTAQNSKKDKRGKGKKRQGADVAAADVSDPLAANPAEQTQEEVVHIEAEVVPSVEHNGKLGHRGKEEKKAARKAARKAEGKALKKAEKKRLRKEEKSQKQGGNKAERKAAKKAARKAKKQDGQQDAGAEIISFDDIIEERHGDPIPNPLPPVEGAATEPDNAVGRDVNAIDNKAERRHQKKLQKQQHKAERKERRHHKEHITCDSNSDCGHGSCCVDKKGTKFCIKSRKDEGQKCSDDCMCRAGLVCVTEEVIPGKERGFCRVSGTAELDTGSNIGAVEDAVEDVMGANQ